MTDERGLVISCPIEVASGSVLVKRADLDPQELRSNLLFWDKLDFPDQFYIGFGLGPDSEFLLKENILQRTKVDLPGGEMGEILRAAHIGGSAYSTPNNLAYGAYLRGRTRFHSWTTNLKRVAAL
jgi:hypothetical protein